MYVDRVSKFFFEVFIGLHFMNAQQVHDLQYAMCHTARTRYSNFYIGQFQSKISMHQFLKTVDRAHPGEFESTCSLTISHHTVVSANNAGKKAKTNDPGAII